MRIALARALFLEPTFLLLDEVRATLELSGVTGLDRPTVTGQGGQLAGCFIMHINLIVCQSTAAHLSS